MRARGLVAISVWAAVVVLGLVLVVPAVLSVKEYVQGSSFGEPCGAGETPCGAGKLEEPSGIAVNSTTVGVYAGDVYVADQGDDRVERFTGTGGYRGQFNGGSTYEDTEDTGEPIKPSTPAPAGILSSPEYVADDSSTTGLDPALGDVYVTDNGHHVVDEFTAAGAYVGKLEGTCKNTEEVAPCPGSELIPFGELLGVAVGSAGEVWVHDNTGNFDEFTDTGVYTTTFNKSAEQPGGIGLDSEGNVYANAHEAREGRKYSPTGGVEAEFAGSGVSGLAVASLTGDVLVDKASGLELYGPIVEESGQAPIQRFATGSLAESHGVAVNSVSATQTVYASERAADDVQSFNYLLFPTVTVLPSFEVSNSVETLSGDVEPEGEVVTGCRFEYGLVGAEPGHYEHSVLCAQSAGSITGVSVGVSQTVSGLVPGATYHFRLDATNANGTGSSGDATFTLFPGVGGESFSGAGSSSVTLHAVVVPGGVPTSFYFEYGPGAGYGFVTPVEEAGAGVGGVSVEAKVEGLLPDTAYSFRVVASSADGVVRGAGSVFSTLPVGVLGLPDGRGYELVSSLENGDATVVPERGGRAADDGSRVAYAGQSPLIGGNGSSEFHGNGISGVEHGDNQYLATREGSGWNATDIQPEGVESAIYHGFPSGLTVGFLTSEVPLVGGAPAAGSGPGLYDRDNGSGAYGFLGLDASYVGATADGSHVLFEEGRELYELVGGVSYPVNVLPGGGLAQNASFGGPPYTEPDLSNVISSDGSRVFWSEEEPLEKRPVRLFVSEGVGGPGERTVQVDAAEPGCASCASGGGLFWTASGDGSKVFFTDEHQLTAQSNAVSGQPDLYEYDLDTNTLTDLTPATTNPGEHANVVGVLGASSDGSYVYFAAAGSLAGSGASPQTCSPAVEGQHEPVSEAIKCDVYVLHGGEAPRLVAAVTNFDGEGGILTVTHGGDWVRVVGDRSSFVSGDGSVLVFKSIEDLTGFDGMEDQEIYSYEYGAGLTCVSCNSSGAPTVHGGPYAVDAELPGSGSVSFALRDLSVGGGRVFFTTVEGLVSGDGNGRQDVYEWERPGVGSCVVGGSSYSGVNGGCLFVLSGGTSTDESFFLDASESGDDAFVETRAQLVPRDHTELYEVYDARVGATGESALPVCSGAGCQGVPGAPPVFATPSSVTFNGIGNFPPPVPVKSKARVVKCKKGFVKKHDKCVKSKPRRKVVAKKKVRAKRASHERGGRS
jgi:hypothetical protein